MKNYFEIIQAKLNNEIEIESIEISKKLKEFVTKRGLKN